MTLTQRLTALTSPPAALPVRLTGDPSLTAADIPSSVFTRIDGWNITAAQITHLSKTEQRRLNVERAATCLLTRLENQRGPSLALV
jgi:hypothetical protein